MAVYSLSDKAADDLDAIYEYTILNFGLEQARKYLLHLDARFADLADNPLLGRSADELAEGLRRVEYQSHIVFYKSERSGVLILRVLHVSMDAARHL